MIQLIKIFKLLKFNIKKKKKMIIMKKGISKNYKMFNIFK